MTFTFGLVLLIVYLPLAVPADPVHTPAAPGEFLSKIPYASYLDDAKVPDGRMFDVRDFGAVGDRKTMNTSAIARAIAAAHESGGGVVRIEGGDYISGTIQLKTNVTLYIAKSAILRASRSRTDYEPAHFIYSENASNVAVVGPGRVLGEGDAWWTPPRAVAPVAPPDVFNLKEMEAMHFAAKRRKIPNRPSPFIRLRGCTDVKINNLVVENSPGWTIMLDHCDRVRIEGVVLNNNYHGENTDGIDVVGSSDIDITRCFVSTGDDGIVLKNGYANETSRAMSNVRIANCAIRSAANCIKIGTETWSDISGVRIADCELFTEEIWPWGLAALAIESVDGARVRDITAENITVRNMNTPLFIRLGNRNRWKNKDRAGGLEAITVKNLRATGIEFPCVISGIPGLNVKDVTLEDFEIACRESGERLDIDHPIPEAETQYPEFWMFGDLPAFALYARHVNRLVIRDFRATPRRANQRDPVVFDDVSDLHMND